MSVLANGSLQNLSAGNPLREDRVSMARIELGSCAVSNRKG